MENLVYFLISFGLMGMFFFVMAAIFLFMLRKNSKWYATVIAGFIYCAVAAGGTYMLAQITSGQDVISYTKAEMQKNLDKTLAEAEKKGATKEDIAMIKNGMEMFVLKPLPAWALISAAFLVFLVYFVVRLYALNKYGITDGMPPFELWRIPEQVMWAMIACMSALVFNGVIKNQVVFDIAYNLAFILAAVYFAAGLAVSSYMFIKYKVPAPAKFFFYLLLVIWSFSGIIVILAGMLDTWFNFRKLEKGGTAWK